MCYVTYAAERHSARSSRPCFGSCAERSKGVSRVVEEGKIARQGPSNNKKEVLLGHERDLASVETKRASAHRIGRKMPIIGCTKEDNCKKDAFLRARAVAQQRAEENRKDDAEGPKKLADPSSDGREAKPKAEYLGSQGVRQETEGKLITEGTDVEERPEVIQDKPVN
ncbi:hypothetical protein KM043_002071 [Ampulex compressa]|nr:hypothetical protein KM043_002071 [Ampulex compressa]